MTHKDTANVFVRIINSVLHHAMEEGTKDQGDVIEKLKELSPEKYAMEVNYKLSLCIDAFHPDSSAAFIFANYDYVENAFTYLIKNAEGSACSVDKSRHIVRALYDKFKNDKEFELSGDHYWISNALTPELCEKFFKAIVSAFYGNHKPLISFYVTTPAESSNDKST